MLEVLDPSKLCSLGSFDQRSRGGGWGLGFIEGSYDDLPGKIVVLMREGRLEMMEKSV